MSLLISMFDMALIGEEPQVKAIVLPQVVCPCVFLSNFNDVLNKAVVFVCGVKQSQRAHHVAPA